MGRENKMTKNLEQEEIEILKKAIAQARGIKLILDYSESYADLLYWGEELIKAGRSLAEKNRLYNIILSDLIEYESELSKLGIIFDMRGFRKIKK